MNLKSPKFIVFLLLVTAVGGIALFVFGRSLWFPFYLKIRGERTVAEVGERLEAERDVGKELAGWDRLLILGFKEERFLEVWGIKENGTPQKIKEYPFKGYSGELGPKLREGDGQIPEGIYQIEYLNPNSRYHLSIKLNYPNEFDREKGRLAGRDRLGFDIFIHGKTVTIGCIPIGDRAIEELFVLVANAGIENVDVILSPYDMREGVREIDIEEIDWEGELYGEIRRTLSQYQLMEPDRKNSEVY